MFHLFSEYTYFFENKQIKKPNKTLKFGELERKVLDFQLKDAQLGVPIGVSGEK